MRTPGDNGHRLDAAIAVVAIAVLLFASPLRALWSAPGRSWLLPFALWAGIVALAWLVQRIRDSHGL